MEHNVWHFVQVVTRCNWIVVDRMMLAVVTIVNIWQCFTAQFQKAFFWEKVINEEIGKLLHLIVVQLHICSNWCSSFVTYTFNTPRSQKCTDVGIVSKDTPDSGMEWLIYLEKTNIPTTGHEWRAYSKVSTAARLYDIINQGSGRRRAMSYAIVWQKVLQQFAIVYKIICNARIAIVCLKILQAFMR